MTQNAMLRYGQPVMHDAPADPQPWYRQPGYRPTNLMLDMAAKYIAQPVYNLMTGGLHQAADEYELGGRGRQALPGKAFDAAGAAMMGNFAARPALPRNSASRPAQPRHEPTKADVDIDPSGFQRNYLDSQWTIESKDGMSGVGGYLKDDGTLQITSSSVHPDQRGQGLGLALYKALVDDAFAQGRGVVSDGMVSESATRIYDALSRRGYGVMKNPHVRNSGNNFGANRVDYKNADYDHVFRVEPIGQSSSAFYSNPFFVPVPSYEPEE